MLRPCLVREDLSSHTPKTILLPRLSPNKGFVISFCSILSSSLLRHPRHMCSCCDTTHLEAERSSRRCPWRRCWRPPLGLRPRPRPLDCSSPGAPGASQSPAFRLGLANGEQKVDCIHQHFRHGSSSDGKLQSKCSLKRPHRILSIRNLLSWNFQRCANRRSYLLSYETHLFKLQSLCSSSF